MMNINELIFIIHYLIINWLIMAAEEVSGNIVDTQSSGREDESGTLDEPVYVTIVSSIINPLVII